MYELRVVALSEDARYVVLAPVLEGRRERYRVPVDDRLRAALRGELGRLERRIRPDSALTPREIQARVRAGETAETIAAAAGVAVEWVLRFETPVLAERAQVARQARHASLSVSGGEWTGVPLEEIVAARLEADGNRSDVADWDAWRRDDGRWVLQVRVGTFLAHWLWDPALQRLVVHDDAARSLLHQDGPAIGPATALAEPRRLALAPQPAEAVEPSEQLEPSEPLEPSELLEHSEPLEHSELLEPELLEPELPEPELLEPELLEPELLEPEVLVELRSEAPAGGGAADGDPDVGNPDQPADAGTVAPAVGVETAGDPAVEAAAEAALPETALPETALPEGPAADQTAADQTRSARRAGRRKSVPSWEDILLGTGAGTGTGTGSGGRSG